MGLEAGTLAGLLGLAGSVGGSALSSAFSPSPYQPRQSFRGTTADPVQSLTHIQSILSGLLDNQMPRAMSDPALPDAVVGDVPSFTGGNLPGPIGVSKVPTRLKATGSPTAGMLTGGPTAPVPGAGIGVPPSPPEKERPFPGLDSPLLDGNTSTGNTPVAAKLAGMLGPRSAAPSSAGAGAPAPAPDDPMAAFMSKGAGVGAGAGGGMGGGGVGGMNPQTSGALQLLLHAAMMKHGQPSSPSA